MRSKLVPIISAGKAILVACLGLTGVALRLFFPMYLTGGFNGDYTYDEALGYRLKQGWFVHMTDYRQEMILKMPMIQLHTNGSNIGQQGKMFRLLIGILQLPYVEISIPDLPKSNDHSRGHYRGWVNRLIAQTFAETIRSVELKLRSLQQPPDRAR
jgi:hypothetical protein